MQVPAHGLQTNNTMGLKDLAAAHPFRAYILLEVVANSYPWVYWPLSYLNLLAFPSQPVLKAALAFISDSKTFT